MEDNIKRYCFVKLGVRLFDESNHLIEDAIEYSVVEADHAIIFCKEDSELMVIDSETGLICYEPGDSKFNIAEFPWEVKL